MDLKSPKDKEPVYFPIDFKENSQGVFNQLIPFFFEASKLLCIVEETSIEFSECEEGIKYQI